MTWVQASGNWRVSAGGLSPRPLLPLRLGEPDREVHPLTNHRHFEQKRFFAQLCKPCFIRHACVLQAQILISCRRLIYKGGDSELLREPPELAQGCGTPVEIDEVCLDSSLSKESKCLS